MTAKRVPSSVLYIFLHAFTLLFIHAFAASDPGGARASDTTQDDIKTLFKSKCSSCHGMDGSANTAIGKELKATDLRSTKTQGKSDKQLSEIISNGRDKMPSFGRSLGEEKCRQLAAYLRELSRPK